MDTRQWSEGYKEGLRQGRGWAKLGMEFAGTRPGQDDWQKGFNEGYRLGFKAVMAGQKEVAHDAH